MITNKKHPISVIPFRKPVIMTHLMRILSLFALLVLIAIFSMPSELHAATARESMEKTINDVLIILKDPSLKGDDHLSVKKERLWTVMDKTFNYTLLSRQALGKNWTQITPEQQKEFVRLYSALLGNTYLDRIIAYGDEKVEITKEIPLSKSIFEVQTVIHAQNGEIPVFYRLNMAENQWRVFDVVIEGVSLTMNYRSQFKDFLAKKTMNDLLSVLKKKQNASK